MACRDPEVFLTPWNAVQGLKPQFTSPFHDMLLRVGSHFKLTLLATNLIKEKKEAQKSRGLIT